MSSTFRRYTSANLNVWFFDDHASIDWLASSATIFSCQHPLAISVGETVDWNDAYAGLIVAAVARSETNAPPSLEDDSVFAGWVAKSPYDGAR